VRQEDPTPVHKQDTLDLVLAGVNDIKVTLKAVERRTDGALNLAFRAHEKAKTALWARTTWAPFIASALALAIAAVSAGYTAHALAALGH
jgi:hypothetical protein